MVKYSAEKDIPREDPGLRIESFAVINLRGVSTNKTIIYSQWFKSEIPNEEI
jgi:hypothetical protein